jgi:hypothetical protein
MIGPFAHCTRHQKLFYLVWCEFLAVAVVMHVYAGTGNVFFFSDILVNSSNDIHKSCLYVALSLKRVYC